MAEKAVKNANAKELLGGISKRFNTIETSQLTPGPGFYYQEKNPLPKLSNSVFVSKTKRNYELSGYDEGPGIGYYNSINFGSIGNKARVERGGGSSLFRFLSIDPNKKPGFQSASRRFHIKSILL